MKKDKKLEELKESVHNWEDIVCQMIGHLDYVGGEMSKAIKNLEKYEKGLNESKKTRGQDSNSL